ncbi:hypothetical protein [Streptomyces platensis]|uniref:hypothetical protein n=1 Tax=Streptomyces platensis TaxID=58346 RepID=UPI001F3D33A7|nr:hypothetical protein [Streptomyces platensis]MCF3142467.1 hypothetical protein [Streptomyces platensis]
MFIRGKNPRGRTAAVLIAFTAGLLLTTTACADAKKADPQKKTFPFSGKKLNVRTNDNPTDLVAADIKDVRVTLWFHEGASLGDSNITWELKGDTLDLDASCSGLADCDTKFRVQVPRDTTVLRNGNPTSLKG